jgi:hypothetical protein
MGVGWNSSNFHSLWLTDHTVTMFLIGLHFCMVTGLYRQVLFMCSTSSSRRSRRYLAYRLAKGVQAHDGRIVALDKFREAAAGDISGNFA